MKIPCLPPHIDIRTPVPLQVTRHPHKSDGTAGADGHGSPASDQWSGAAPRVPKAGRAVRNTGVSVMEIARRGAPQDSLLILLQTVTIDGISPLRSWHDPCLIGTRARKSLNITPRRRIFRGESLLALNTIPGGGP